MDIIHSHHSHHKHGGAGGERPEGLSEEARALRDSGEGPARIPPDNGGGDTLEPIAHERGSGPRLAGITRGTLGPGHMHVPGAHCIISFVGQ